MYFSTITLACGKTKPDSKRKKMLTCVISILCCFSFYSLHVISCEMSNKTNTFLAWFASGKPKRERKEGQVSMGVVNWPKRGKMNFLVHKKVSKVWCISHLELSGIPFSKSRNRFAIHQSLFRVNLFFSQDEHKHLHATIRKYMCGALKWRVCVFVDFPKPSTVLRAIWILKFFSVVFHVYLFIYLF